MKSIMQYMKSLMAIAVALAIVGMPAMAAEDKVSGSFMPYFWAAGLNGGLDIGPRTANADTNFGDIFNHVKGGFSFMADTEYKNWINYLQADWFNTRWDKTSSDLGNATLRSNFVDATGATGHRFKMFYEGAATDVGVGVRYTHMKNKLSTGPFPTLSHSRDLIDGIFLLRPIFPMGKVVSLVVPATVGGGQSDLTYDFTPQFQFNMSEHWMASVGYRQLYYRHHNDAGRFDGYFHGGVLGLGFKF